jgi:WD40 repeat protein
VTDQITPGGVVNIFTGGEDGFIKVWDSACRIIQTVDMRKSQVLSDLNNKRAFGVQSLDIYICDKKNARRVLAGLRCGEIMEAMINLGGEAQKDEEEAKQASIMKLPPRAAQALMPSMNFDWYSYLSSHASLHVNSNLKKV